MELFPVTPRLPEGFSYHENFITPEEESELYRYITTLDFHTFMFHGYEAKRRVANFGYDYSFTNKSLAKGEDIPLYFLPLITKVARQTSLPENAFAELLVTEYPVGSVINWHRDAFPFDLIAGISIHSNCTFRLRPYDKAKQNRKSTVSLPVERRSLYIISGSSRIEWEHSIAPVQEVRYSITLRTLKQHD
jgi:alkylated DNA repair dioxygenase AlkB